MTFIIEGIIESLLLLTFKLTEWIIGRVSTISFDIGYLQNGKKGILDDTFPGAEKFMTIFLSVGMILVFSILLFKLFQAYFSPILSSAEHPLTIVGRSLIAIFCVAFSYNIFLFIETMAGKIYAMFANALPLSKDLTNAYQKATEDGSSSSIFSGQSGADIVDHLIKDVGVLEGVVLLLFVFIIFFALVWNLIKLFLEMFARYVILGLLFYTAPLAFAMISSESTSNIFSSWCRMVGSQIILLCINTFFLLVFRSAFISKFYMLANGQYAFASADKFLEWGVLVIAWLVVGQQVDQYLQSLGLSTAQAGAGLMSSIMVGAIATKAAFDKIGSIGNKGAKAGAAIINNGKAGIPKAMDALEGRARWSDIFNNRNTQGSFSDNISRASSPVNEMGETTNANAQNILKGDAIVTGSDAKKNIEALGISTEEGSPFHNAADFSIGDGQIKAFDEYGNIQAQYFDPTTHTTDSMVRPVTTSSGQTFAEPVSQQILANDNTYLKSSLETSYPDLEWRNVGNHLVGYKGDKPFMQANYSYVGNAGVSAINKTLDNGASYQIREFRNFDAASVAQSLQEGKAAFLGDSMKEINPNAEIRKKY